MWKLTSFRRLFLLGITLLAFAAPVSALRAGPCYWPCCCHPFIYLGDLGPGYFLQGTASVVNATGNLYIQQEQARITREQAHQAKLETRRKAFDQNLYEKANTPTFTEIQEQNLSFRLRRLMNSATDTEIKDGRALNAMLPYLNELAGHGALAVVPLDPDILRRINISGAGDHGSLGVLGMEGKPEWPLVLQGHTTRVLDELLAKAVNACRDGTMDFVLYRSIKKQVEKLDEEHRKKLHREEIDGGEYLVGKRFLESLESAVRLIDSPTARQVLSGRLRATGRTIAELAQDMAAKGLKFAPATPGYESAYHGLMSKMVTCASGVRLPNGVAVSPARPRSFITTTPNLSGR